MKILFLGTGAADWGVRVDGQEHRRFSSALIDGELLIDFSSVLPDAMREYGVEPSQIKYILNTHKHRDHFDRDVLTALTDGGAEFFDVSVGETVAFGKYTVTALPANHSTAKDAKHFMIFDGEKRIFYALDGAWLLYGEVTAIKENGVDLAVLDATVGEVEGDYRVFEHNSLPMIRIMKRSLEGHVKRFIISHMARTLHTDHKTLIENMAKDGIDVAYDGLEIEI